MLTMLLVLALAAVSPQNPPAAAPACALLTAQEVTSLIGPAKPLTVTNSPKGSTCMFQNQDKVITVLMVMRDSNESGKMQWEAKKLAAAAQDVPGWNLPVYSGTVDHPKEHVAIVGVAKGKLFAEVKAMDISQKTSDLSAKLLVVMKSASARM